MGGDECFCCGLWCGLCSLIVWCCVVVKLKGVEGE